MAEISAQCCVVRVGRTVLRQVEGSERTCDCVCFLVECFVISFTE